MAIHDRATTRLDTITQSLSVWENAFSWDDCTEAVRTLARYELLDIVGAMVAGRSLLGLPAWLAAMIDASGGEVSGRCKAIGQACLAPQTAARQLADSLLSTSESRVPPTIIATANAAMAAHAKQR